MNRRVHRAKHSVVPLVCKPVKGAKVNVESGAKHSRVQSAKCANRVGCDVSPGDVAINVMKALSAVQEMQHFLAVSWTDNVRVGPILTSVQQGRSVLGDNVRARAKHAAIAALKTPSSV